MKQTTSKNGPIHWDQVHGRLRASAGALDEALSASPQRMEAIYRERAARLAEVPPEHISVSAAMPVLVFRLANERYAMELKELADVLLFERCAPVPGAPAQCLGVVNVRGELRAVVDLERLLTPSAQKTSGAGFVLLLGCPRLPVALKVDSIEGLAEIRQEELSAPGPGKHLKGIAGGTLMLLDMDQVMAENFPLEEALTT